ncbi:MAG: hypothetical protein HY275_08785 [Gemmatimonadetes bacterium]|nr:hypothetical protein [Gemmatimonadota bacterium]
MPSRSKTPASRSASRSRPKAAAKPVTKPKAAAKKSVPAPKTVKPKAKAAARPKAAKPASPKVTSPKPAERAPQPTLRLVSPKGPSGVPVVRPANLSAGDARSKDVMEIDWALFGELSRALALKVARAWDPDVVLGIATAGVIPGATIAAILDREFHSMIISRRYHAETVRATPAVFGQVPAEVRDQHVLIVDETCDSGATMRLAVAAVLNAGAADVRTAVSFRTGSYAPDFVGLETDAEILLPWDREILVNGELVLNPDFADLIR